jgi:hypothetical protein
VKLYSLVKSFDVNRKLVISVAFLKVKKEFTKKEENVKEKLKKEQIRR